MNIRHATRMLFRHRTLSPQTCRMISVKTNPPRETSSNSFGHHSLADNSGRLAANLEEVRGELLDRNIDSSSLSNRLEHELFNEYYDKADQTVDLLIETCRKNNETEDLARLYFMKGMISKGKGQESEGTPFLLRALSLSGDKLMETLEPTMLLLGFEMITEYYLSQSNYSSALEWQDSVIHLAQRHKLINHRHFDQRSFILARLGKYGEAIDDLKRSIDIQFDLFGRVNKESQNDLALLKCRHAMGRKLYRKALISLENYLNSNTNLQTVDYELIVTKVEIMEKLGMVNGAVTYLWQVQKSLDTDHLTKLAPLIQFKIAELLMSIGRYDEALDTLELLSTEYTVSKDMTGQIEELHFIVSETKKQHHAKRAPHKGAGRTTTQQTANLNKRPK